MKTRLSTHYRWDQFVIVTCVAIMLMAFVVLVGWYAHIRAAIQIFDGLIPMQYNTSLCFLALGAAGVGLSSGRRLLQLGAGSFIALMGAAVILEYASGSSFGIDNLFFNQWERTLSLPYPGRMSLSTSICFFLSGGVLVILAARPRAHAVFALVNSIPLSLALTSLIAYSFHLVYILPFGLGSQMALHTSAAFLVYGIAMLGHAWKHTENGPHGLPEWAFGLGVTLLPVMLVCASALFPRQSWRVASLEVLIALLGVGFVSLAFRALSTAKVAYKGLMMIAIPLVLLLIFVGLVVRVKDQSYRAQALALHSRKVIDISHSLLAQVTETESAVRGYLITRDETLVGSYEASLASIAQTLATLREVVGDNPLQQANVKEIERVTTQRMDFLSHSVYLIQTSNNKELDELIKGRKGQDLSKQLRAEIGRFGQEEESRDAGRRQGLDTSWQQLSWLLVSGTAAAILLASILCLLFSGSISGRLHQLRGNATNLAAGKQLSAPLAGHDEIAELDMVFHEMADSLDELTRREKAVIEGTTDAVFVKDLEHRFLMINQAGADLFGKTVAEIVGASVYDVLSPDSARKVVEQNERTIAEGKTVSYELETTTKSGVQRTYWTTRGPYHDRYGKVVGLIVINRDITARKQIEAELEQARDAAIESVRLKAAFLANMSHEIRTPMNGVIGMTDLLLETTLSFPQREFTETIQSSADSLLTIINDILDFSKIEAGLLRFEKIDFDLRGAVEACVDQLAEQARSKGLELASLVHADVPTALQGDPGRLRQVLNNLAGNAVKFTERGEVVLTVTKISETASHARLRFEVEDSGIGISAEAQLGLFRAFSQADGSTTRKYGGTGLGLVISKQLVELMGGAIGIESTPGVGSIFWFVAEFAKQTLIAAATSTTPGTFAGAKVLIVDDNAKNRSILTHQTRSWGMIASEAESGKLALERLRAAAAQLAPYNIVIMDLNMPEMDGFQLAEAIKAEPAISAVTLVLLPSFGEPGHGEHARQLGIAAYLQKPVRQAKLYECLTTLLTRSASPETTMPGPLVTQHSLREAELRLKQRAFSSVRIIIAEDNIVNQKVALRQLHNLGFRAEVVPNGRELLKALEATEVDLILMDCQMPEMDGFAATAEIRRREGVARHTTIVAMTANALDGDQEKCLAAGMDDYLSKPVKAEALRLKLERWTNPPPTAPAALLE